MKFLKVWIGCCLFFCVYCLCLLNEESYQVAYSSDDHKDNELLKYLGCLSLKSPHLKGFLLNRTKIDLYELRAIFHEYFQKLSVREISRVFLNTTKQMFKEMILNRTRLDDQVVVFRNNVCVILKGTTELHNFLQLTKFEGPMFVFKADTLNWVRIDKVGTKFDQLIVLKKGAPYSNCTKGFSRAHCLLDCFKRRFRLSKYFYYTNESGPIYLNQSTNQTVKDHEDACFLKCNSRSNCKLVYLSPLEEDTRDGKVFIFRAEPTIDSFEFGAQLAGLVCLIAGLSYHQLTSITIQLASPKLANKQTSICLFYLKLAAFVVGLLCGGYLLFRMIIEYKNQTTNPTKKETTRSLMQPKRASLLICMTVETIFARKRNTIFKKIDYGSMPIHELEKATDGALEEVIDYIALDYRHNRNKSIRWEITPKVLFKKSVYSFLQRCFNLVIYPQEPHYQMLLSTSQVIVKFKFNFLFELFLIAESDNLSEESFELPGHNTFLKRINKRSRLNGKCVDYAAICPHLKCSTRRSCLERCIQRSFFTLHHNVTTGTFGFLLVIDKDQFSAAEWMGAYFEDEFDEKEEADTMKKCMNEIPDGELCSLEVFEEGVKIDFLDAETIELDIYYKVIRSVENEPSSYKLMLDLLSVQSILFGLTVLKLFQLIYDLLDRFKIKNKKAVLPLIYLACSIGCSWHIYQIFDEIVNSKLTYDQHYSIANRMAIPELVVCLDFDLSSAEENKTLTGNYLEELTSQMNDSTIFESIAYLNSQNQWIELKTNLSDKIFHMETFYFQFKKWSDKFSLN